MKITVFAAGSRGDIQPCVVLCKGLQQAGYCVRLAAPEDFADFVQAHEVDFYPLRGDVQQIMASDTGRKFMESGGSNPFKSINAVRKMIAPVIKQMAEDAYAACQDAQAIICLGVFSAFGQAIAEALGIPIIHNGWHAVEAGFWKPTPHLVLEEGFDYPEQSIYLDQAIVIENDGKVSVYRNWFQDYSRDSITRELEAGGFEVQSVWNDLTGTPAAEDAEWIGVIAQKEQL